MALSATGLAVACTPAPAVSARSGDGALSPRLAELAKPSLRSAPREAQAQRLSVASEGPGSLLRQGSRVLVDVRFDGGAAAAADDLRAAGAQVVHLSRRYQAVTVAARPAGLPALADVARVSGVTEILAPVTSATACTGLVTSEGDSQLSAKAARTDFNLDGSGVSVGLLSDSFDTDGNALTHAAGDVLSGDLPGPGNTCGRTTAVNRLDDSYAEDDAADEGRALAQIVHDLAPGASLAFATAFTGELGFAANIRNLAKAGSTAIVDDVAYFEEPFFQDGPVAVAINDVAAAGVAYFSAAGNDNLIDGEGNDIASWEAPSFRDSLTCPAALLGSGATHCMDFDPEAGVDDTFGITVEAGATLTIDLQWAEPWLGVKTDLDVFLLDSTGQPVEFEGSPVESVEDNVGGSQRPFEFLQWENDSNAPVEVQLAIDRCFGVCNPGASAATAPRLKFALLQNGGGVTATEYPKSAAGDTVGPTIFGHSGAEGAMSIGAVPYSNSSALEPYSSRGPVSHYFGPASGATAAAPLAPKTISKPDLVATDCGLTTFFVPTKVAGINRFCGTSAAAPHAAAVAALMREANPSLSVSQLRTALATTARPVGAFGANAVGAGLVNAYGAVGRVALPPVVRITQAPQAVSKNRSPSIGFAANRPVTFGCSLDGSPLFACTAPFVPAEPLADGLHGFAARGVDLAARAGMSETVWFRVDTKRPRTFFRARPRKTIRTRGRRARAVFRFGSNEDDVNFVCRVDRGLFRFCAPRLVRRFRVGEHAIRVRAVDKAGNADATPAVYHFRVKRVG